jgi:hypothetical protein
MSLLGPSSVPLSALNTPTGAPSKSSRLLKRFFSMQAHELYEAFIRPIEKAGFPYFVTGSIASIVYGDPRLTHDIDIVIHLTTKDIPSLSKFFPEDDYYCPPTEVIHIEIGRQGSAGHLNLIHHKTGLKADLYPDTGDALHGWAFKNKRRLELAPDMQLWVAPPEYVIIRKLEYYRNGGSQKHLSDIRKMLTVSGDQIDTEFLEKEIKERDLVQHWDKCDASKT